MKILLFGNGQVGWELRRSLKPVGEIVSLTREVADFSDPECLRKLVNDAKPDIIVNAVAYTAVDKAEEEEELALQYRNNITYAVGHGCAATWRKDYKSPESVQTISMPQCEVKPVTTTLVDNKGLDEIDVLSIQFLANDQIK